MTEAVDYATQGCGDSRQRRQDMTANAEPAKQMIRFECGQEDRVGEDLGPFEFLQMTYGDLRVGPTGDEVLAYFDNGWWITTDGQRWSDFVIWGES